MEVRGKAVAKAKVKRVHRATALRRPAATARKGDLALKVKAMVAANLSAMANAKAAVAKSSAAIPVLTTVRMAKGVRLRVAHAQRVVAVVKAAGKTANATMAMNCHATLTL